MTFSWLGWRVLGLLLLSATTSCQLQAPVPPETQGNSDESPTQTQGDILSDDITEEFTQAIARAYTRQQPKSALTVGTRSSEETIRAFCQGQARLIVVSRPLSGAEQDLCQKNGVEEVKFPLGYAAVAAIASPDARWLTCLTPAQLKQLDQALAKKQPLSWQQIDSSYPALDVQIISSPTATPTQLLRAKGYKTLASAVPQMSFQTVQKKLLESVGPMALVGLAQATQLESKALLVPLRHASTGQCVIPTVEAVLGARYTELARPMLAYVSVKALDGSPPLKSFMLGLIQVVQAQAARRISTTPASSEKAVTTSATAKPSAPQKSLQLPENDPALAAYVPISSTLVAELLDELQSGDRPQASSETTESPP